MPLLCPKCGVQIELDATECGMCLRRRTRKQIFAGYRNVEAAAKGPSFGEKYRTWAVIVGLLGVLAVGVKINLNEPPAALAPAPVPASSPARAADSGQAGPDDKTPAAAAGGFMTERPAGLPGGFDAESAQGAQGVWTIKGKAYDLISLKEVAGVRLTFKDSETGKGTEVVTDQSGSYSIELKVLKDGGYLAEASHKGYLEDYLEDMEPSYSTQDIVRRKEALNLSATSRILHLPISPESAGSLFQYDIFLLPRR